MCTSRELHSTAGLMDHLPASAKATEDGHVEKVRQQGPGPAVSCDCVPMTSPTIIGV